MLYAFDLLFLNGEDPRKKQSWRYGCGVLPSRRRPNPRRGSRPI